MSAVEVGRGASDASVQDGTMIIGSCMLVASACTSVGSGSGWGNGGNNGNDDDDDDDTGCRDRSQKTT